MMLDDQFEHLYGLVRQEKIDDAVDALIAITDEEVICARNVGSTEAISEWLSFWSTEKLLLIGSIVACDLVTCTKGARCPAWDRLALRVRAVYPQHSAYIESMALETPYMTTRDSKANPFLDALNKGKQLNAEREDKLRKEQEARLADEIPLARQWIEKCLPERITEKARFDIADDIPLQGILYVNNQGVSADAVAHAINTYYKEYLNCVRVEGKDRYSISVREGK